LELGEDSCLARPGFKRLSLVEASAEGSVILPGLLLTLSARFTPEKNPEADRVLVLACLFLKVEISSMLPRLAGEGEGGAEEFMMA